MIPQHVVAICREYARLECTARKAEREPKCERYAPVFRNAAHLLIEMAPGDALPHLDAVKKVLEIDTAITDRDMVLLRASLEPDTTP